MTQPKIKLSQLSVASSITPGNSLMILQNGTNKLVSFSTIFSNIDSTSNIRINPSQNAIDTIFATSGDVNALVVEGTTNRIGIGIATPQSKLHVGGNIQVGSSSSDGVLITSSETVSFISTDTTKVISPSRVITDLTLGSGVTTALFTLAAGAQGQTKTIVIGSMQGAATVEITTTGVGFNTVVLSAVGHSVVLQYFTALNAWVAIGGNGYTLATI